MIEQREFSKNLYAGLFFIIGIILICVVVLSIGMDKGITQPKFKMTVLFREVGGLMVGAPIRLSGVNVGTVGKIDFLKEEVMGRGVAVTLNLFTRYKDQIEHGYSFSIKTEGILGQKFVEISKDTTELKRRMNLNNAIIGEDPLDVQDLAETFGTTAVSLQETAKVADLTMMEIRDRFKTLKRILNRVEQHLIDGTLFKVF